MHLSPGHIPATIPLRQLADGPLEDRQHLLSCLRRERFATAKRGEVELVATGKPPKLEKHSRGCLGRVFPVPGKDGIGSLADQAVAVDRGIGSRDRGLQLFLPADRQPIVDVERVGDRVGLGDRSVVGEQFDSPPAAWIVAVPADVVDVFRILLGGQRRVEHHVGGADVAVLHVALRRIDDLHQILLRMDALPGGGARRAINRPRPVVAVGPDRGGAVADVRDVALDVGAHHVLFVVLMQAEGLVELLNIRGPVHPVKLFVEAGLIEIRRGPDIGDACGQIGLADHRAEVRKEGRLRDHAAILDRNLEDLHLHRSPLAVVFVFRQRIEPKLHAIDIGGVGAAGGQGPAHASVVADREHR